MATPQASPEITVRNRRFARGTRDRTQDRVAAAWFLALSAAFPNGEAMFIDAVRAFRDDAPPRLAAEIRDFIRQEINHTREHVGFNRAAELAGYDVAPVIAKAADLVRETQQNPPLVQLAITMALEHFTAMFAHEFLARPDTLATAGMVDRDLWMLHAVEEIEHKAVAYDTFLHATRDWKPLKRWMMRSVIMLRVTKRFLQHRSEDALTLMAQDELIGWRARRALFAYLVGKPGLLRRIFPAWLAFFRPDFHPWDIDDRHLIERYDEGERAELPAHLEPAE